jgi:hypothetical protein
VVEWESDCWIAWTHRVRGARLWTRTPTNMVEELWPQATPERERDVVPSKRCSRLLAERARLRAS